MTRKILAVAIASASLWSFSAHANDTNLHFGDWTFSPAIEMVGGVFMNDHLQQGTAGREHQIKMTRVTVGVDAKKDSWEAKVELVGLQDEMRQDAGDRAYKDIYRNLGTDLYYYGDNPVREAWVGQDLGWLHWKAGRMINLMGAKPDGRFLTAPEAPNAVLMSTGLFSGVQAGLSLADDTVNLSVGVMGGNDKPSMGANNYLDGKLDVNEKGNNTPVLEIYGDISPAKGFKVYAGYLRNKKGSAVGSFESGKHNDNRLIYGLDYQPYATDRFALDFGLQASTFTTGLTEEGVQGEATVTESYDIEQDGWYATLAATFPTTGVTVRYTYEEMDRMDALAWKEVAAFDKTHPVNDATEDRQVLAVEKAFESGFAVRAFYRQDNVPYLTGGDAEMEDRAGIVFNYSAQF